MLVIDMSDVKKKKKNNVIRELNGQIITFFSALCPITF